jgi:uncharacterized protein
MNILIDVGHPAHVHLFKFFALEMQKKGHLVLFTCRDKEFEIHLLEANNFKYRSFGRKFSSAIGKIFGMLKFDFLEFHTALKFKPDIFLSHGSMYAAHASALLSKPHISLEDTFNFEQIRLYKPFTDVILTADYEHPLQSGKVVKYSGYHELAYLHPSRFRPDETVLQELGVGKHEKYVILRFVSWKASHDIGHKGISLKNKLKAVELFSKYARVFISSEAKLPEELKKYKIQINPERMHDALAFATMLWAESFTMPAECSVLGTPSIIMHDTTSLYLKEQQEKYGLCFNYSESDTDQKLAIEKGLELLQIDNLKAQWVEKRNSMLEDKIDVTAFLVWFVEAYPQSVNIMTQNPDYQLKFKQNE